MVYDKRPRRENQTPQSYEQQNSSSSRNIYRSHQPSPIIEELRRRWSEKRQARKEMEWFDSLPVLDPDGRGASSTKEATEKPQQASDKGKQLEKTGTQPESALGSEPRGKTRERELVRGRGRPQGRQTEAQEKKSASKQDEDRGNQDPEKGRETEGKKGKGKDKDPNSSKTEERKEKNNNKKEGSAKGERKRRGWFSLFGAGTRPDKKLKPNLSPQQAPTQTDNSNSPDSPLSNNSSTPASSTPSSQSKTTQKNNPPAPKQNQDSGVGSIPRSTQRIELPNQPIFVAPNLDAVKRANPKTVLGKTSGGGIIYISKNPTAEDMAVTQGTGIEALSASQSSNIYKQQRETAIDAIDSVKDRGIEAQTQLTSSSSDPLAQIDNQIASSVTRAEHALAAQKAAVAKIMENSRTSITNQSSQTILAIEGQYNQTLRSIDARTASAGEKLSANRKRLQSQIDRNYETFTRRIDSSIATTRSAYEREYGRTITAIERTKNGYIKSYRKESPKRDSNPIGNLLERIGWDTYVKNWRNAKIEATKKVAQGFAESTTEAFSHNFATLDKYHSTTIEGGKQLATRSKESIATSYQQTQAALFQRAAAAHQSATQTYQQQIASVKNQEAHKLQQINSQQAQYNATLDQQGGEAIAQIQKLGGVLRSSVEGAIATGQENLASAVSGFESGLNLGSGDPKAIARATAAAQTARTALDEALADSQYDIEIATDSALGQIKTTTDEILEGLSGVAQAASMQQASLMATYSEQLKQHSAQAQSTFDSMLTGIAQMLERTVDSTVAQWNPIPEQMVESLISVEVNLGKQLALSETQVIAQRESIMTKLGAEIRSKSKEEADKVQPGWKKVLKLIVNIVITVVVTVAITALAMSGVGLVAGLALAALIGAVGGIAKLAANSAIDGKPMTAGEFFKAAGIGALTGVMEFAGGRAILAAGKGLQAGMVSKIEHLVLDVGVQTATNTAVEVTERLAQGEDFTLKMLGIAVGTSLLSAAGGKYINVKFAGIGQDATAGATKGATGGVAEGVGEGISSGATKGATKGANRGLGRATGEFVADTALDTTINTAGAVANGEELSLGMVAENAAGSLLGKGVAGQASSPRGDKRTGLGHNKGQTTSTGKGKIGQVPTGKNGDYKIDLRKKNKSNTEPQTPRSDTADKATRQPAAINGQRNPDFERVASEGLSRPVEVYSDPDLPGNTVRAEYKLNSKGLVESVHLRAGLGATANDIKLHQQTVKVMRQYGGILGRVRLVEAKIAKWVGINGVPKPGTLAWEAQLEVRKLDGVIGDRLKTLQTADPQEAQRLESEVKYLYEQLKQHRRTFEIQDESAGVGYVAAKGKMGEKITSENAESLRKEVLQSPGIQAKLKQPPAGLLTKQELGEWHWDKNNPGKERPKDLSRRGERLVEGWLEQQDSEVYVTADGRVAFDKSVHDQYQPESKKRKRSEGAETKSKKPKPESELGKDVLTREQLPKIEGVEHPEEALLKLRELAEEVHNHPLSIQHGKEIIDSQKIEQGSYNRDKQKYAEVPNYTVKKNNVFPGIVRAAEDMKYQGAGQTERIIYEGQPKTTVARQQGSGDTSNKVVYGVTPEGKLDKSNLYYEDIADELKQIDSSKVVADTIDSWIKERDTSRFDFDASDASIIAKVTTLMFGQEVQRNHATYATAPMTLKLITHGNKDWGQALEMFPMSPLGAVPASRNFNDYLKQWKEAKKNSSSPDLYDDNQRQTQKLIHMRGMMQRELLLLKEYMDALGLKEFDESKIREDLFETYGLPLKD